MYWYKQINVIFSQNIEDGFQIGASLNNIMPVGVFGAEISGERARIKAVNIQISIFFL